jgi:hypothetical protein
MDPDARDGGAQGGIGLAIISLSVPASFGKENGHHQGFAFCYPHLEPMPCIRAEQRHGMKSCSYLPREREWVAFGPLSGSKRSNRLSNWREADSCDHEANTYDHEADSYDHEADSYDHEAGSYDHEAER